MDKKKGLLRMSSFVGAIINMQKFSKAVPRTPRSDERNAYLESILVALFHGVIPPEGVAACLRLEQSKELIHRFLIGSPLQSHLLFLLQDTSPSPIHKEYELFLVDSLGATLQDAIRGVYFLRKVQGEVQKEAIETSISFGEIEPNALRSWDTVLQYLYSPIISADFMDWGSCDEETRIQLKEELEEMKDKTGVATRDAYSMIRLPIPDLSEVAAELAQPEPRFPQHIIDMCEEAVGDWNTTLSKIQAQHESEVTLLLSPAMDRCGPEGDFFFWKQRQNLCNELSEQAKSRDFRAVATILTSAKSKAMKRWRSVDTIITDATNEARDNCKHLLSLEKPLSNFRDGLPEIQEGLPTVFNCLIQICQFAKHYCEANQITSLLSKIAHHVLESILKSLHEKIPNVWEEDPRAVIEHIEAANQICVNFNKQNTFMWEKLGRMRGFNDLGGSVDKFRIGKGVDALIDRLTDLNRVLVDMIVMVNLEHSTLKSKVTHFVDAFNDARSDLINGCEDPLIIVEGNEFKKHADEFCLTAENVRTALVGYSLTLIEDNATSVIEALHFLEEFTHLLADSNPTANQDDDGNAHPAATQPESIHDDQFFKHKILIVNRYHIELQLVVEIYNKNKHDPPLLRDCPVVVSSIAWSRLLQQRIDEPMQKLHEQIGKLQGVEEVDDVITLYQKVSRTLRKFEKRWVQAWAKSVDAARSGLHASLIILHPKANQLYVNFDRQVLRLMRDTKYLINMGVVPIPRAATSVLQQEEKFKLYHDQLHKVLEEYNELTPVSVPELRPLLSLHLEELERRLAPGMRSLTWLSANIDTYLHALRSGLSAYRTLLAQVFDVLERIDRNLRLIGRTQLVDLPDNQSFSLNQFIARQHEIVTMGGNRIQNFNLEIERAVSELVDLVSASQDSFLQGSKGMQGTEYTHQILRELSEGVVERTVMLSEARSKLTSVYSNRTYLSVLGAIQKAFTLLRRRLGSRFSAGFLFVERPFFDVDVELALPTVSMNPTLEEVQGAVNVCAMQILRVSEKVTNWSVRTSAAPTPSVVPSPSASGPAINMSRRASISSPRVSIVGLSPVPSPIPPTNLYQKVACDRKVVTMVLLLTGSLEALKAEVQNYLLSFKTHSDLWQVDKEQEVSRLVSMNPPLSVYEAEIAKYHQVQLSVQELHPVHNVGCLSLETLPLKNSLKAEAAAWIQLLTKAIIQKIKSELTGLEKFSSYAMGMLSRQPNGWEELCELLNVIDKVNGIDAEIEFTCEPFLNALRVVSQCGASLDKADASIVDTFIEMWSQIRQKLAIATGNLSLYLENLRLVFREQAVTLRNEVTLARDTVSEDDFLSLRFGDIREGLLALSTARLRITGLLDKLLFLQKGERIVGMKITEMHELRLMSQTLNNIEPIYKLHSDALDLQKLIRETSLVRISEETKDVMKVYAHLTSQLTQWKVTESVRNSTCWRETVTLVKVSLAKDIQIWDVLNLPCLRKRHWEAIFEIAVGNVYQPRVGSVSSLSYSSSATPSRSDSARSRPDSAGSADGARQPIRPKSAVDRPMKPSDPIPEHSTVIAHVPRLDLNQKQQRPQSTRGRMETRSPTPAESPIQEDYDFEYDEGGEIKSAESATFQQLLDAGVSEEHLDSIKNIVTAATEEYKVEQTLSRIESDWSGRVFTFITIRPSGFLTLNEPHVAQMIEQLQDTDTVLATLRGYQNNGPWKEQLTHWTVIVAQVLHTLKLFQSVQTMWLQLYGIFSITNSAQRLTQPTLAARRGAETEVGSGILRSFVVQQALFMRLVKRAQEIRVVLSACCNSDSIREHLPSLRRNFEKIRNSLSGYLQSRRVLFPRLFFLGDSDLVDLLTALRQQRSDNITPFLPQLYSGLHEIAWEASLSAEVVDVFIRIDEDMDEEGGPEKDESMEQELWRRAPALLRTKLGEHLVIRHHYKEASVTCPEQCLAAVLAAAKDTLAESISKAYHDLAQDFKAEGAVSAVEKMCDKHPMQICVVAYNLMWSKLCEKSVSRGSDLYGSESAHTWANSLISFNALPRLLQKADSTALRRKLECLIQLSSRCVSDIEDILTPDDLGKRSQASIMDWKWVKRIWYHLQDDGTIRVLIGIYEVPYANEFSGFVPLLPPSPETDRQMVCMTQTIAAGLGTLMTGPPGSSKSDTIRTLASTFGRNLVVFDCSPFSPVSSLSNAIIGSAIGGSWVTFQNPSRLTDLVASALATIMLPVMFALRARRENEYKFEEAVGGIFRRQTSQLTTTYKESELNTRMEILTSSQSTSIPYPNHGIGLSSLSTLPIDGGFAVFMVSCDSGLRKLPPSLDSLFRPLQCSAVDPSYLYTLKLTGLGFSSANTLARQILYWKSLVESALSWCPHFILSTRMILAALTVSPLNDVSKPEEQHLAELLRLIAEPRLSPAAMVQFDNVTFKVFLSGIVLDKDDFVQKLRAEESAALDSLVEPRPDDNDVGQDLDVDGVSGEREISDWVNVEYTARYEVKRLFEKCGINVSKWGKGRARTFDSLLDEVEHGLSRLQYSAGHEKVRRVMRIAKVRIVRGGNILIETHEQNAEGNMKVVWQLLSLKIEPNEMVRDAALRGIRQELGDKYGQPLCALAGRDHEYSTQTFYSASFPGLLTDTEVFTLTVVDPSVLPTGDFTTHEIASNGAVKRHYWIWKAAHEWKTIERQVEENRRKQVLAVEQGKDNPSRRLKAHKAKLQALLTKIITAVSIRMGYDSTYAPWMEKAMQLFDAVTSTTFSATLLVGSACSGKTALVHVLSHVIPLMQLTSQAERDMEIANIANRFDLVSSASALPSKTISREGNSSAKVYLLSSSGNLQDNLGSKSSRYAVVFMSPSALGLRHFLGGSQQGLTDPPVEGLFPDVWKRGALGVLAPMTWIVLDSCIELEWLEGISHLFEANQEIVLASGGGHLNPAPSRNKLVLESDNLGNSTPFILSRIGVVHAGAALTFSQLTSTYCARWVKTSGHLWGVSAAVALIDVLLPAIFARAAETDLKTHILPGGLSAVNVTRNFLDLLDSFLPSLQSWISVTQAGLGGIPSNASQQIPPGGRQQSVHASNFGAVERCVVYCLLWTMGGVLNEEGRDKLEEVLVSSIPAENSGILPKIGSGEKLRDFYLDGTWSWSRWGSLISAATAAEYSPRDEQNSPTGGQAGQNQLQAAQRQSGMGERRVYLKVGEGGADVFIHTKQTLQVASIISATLINGSRPILLSGPTGCGKSSVMSAVCRELALDGVPYAFRTVHQLPGDNGGRLEKCVQEQLEIRPGHRAGPTGGKRIILCIEDVNAINHRRPAEVLRQLIGAGLLSWVEGATDDRTHARRPRQIVDVHYAATGCTDFFGGENGYEAGKEFPLRPEFARLWSLFTILNLAAPSATVLTESAFKILQHAFPNADGSLSDCFKSIARQTAILTRDVLDKINTPTGPKVTPLFDFSTAGAAAAGLTIPLVPPPNAPTVITPADPHPPAKDRRPPGLSNLHIRPPNSNVTPVPTSPPKTVKPAVTRAVGFHTTLRIARSLCLYSAINDQLFERASLDLLIAWRIECSRVLAPVLSNDTLFAQLWSARLGDLTEISADVVSMVQDFFASETPIQNDISSLYADLSQWSVSAPAASAATSAPTPRNIDGPPKRQGSMTSMTLKKSTHIGERGVGGIDDAILANLNGPSTSDALDATHTAHKPAERDSAKQERASEEERFRKMKPSVKLQKIELATLSATVGKILQLSGSQGDSTPVAMSTPRGALTRMDSWAVGAGTNDVLAPHPLLQAERAHLLSEPSLLRALRCSRALQLSHGSGAVISVGTSSALDRSICCVAATLAGTSIWQVPTSLHFQPTLHKTEREEFIRSFRDCIFTAGVRGQSITVIASDRDLLAHNCLLGIAISEVMCAQQLTNVAIKQRDLEDAISELRPRIKESLDRALTEGSEDVTDVNEILRRRLRERIRENLRLIIFCSQSSLLDLKSKLPSLLRFCGLDDGDGVTAPGKDTLVRLAKRYVSDNFRIPMAAKKFVDEAWYDELPEHAAAVHEAACAIAEKQVVNGNVRSVVLPTTFSSFLLDLDLILRSRMTILGNKSRQRRSAILKLKMAREAIEEVGSALTVELENLEKAKEKQQEMLQTILRTNQSVAVFKTKIAQLSKVMSDATTEDKSCQFNISVKFQQFEDRWRQVETAHAQLTKKDIGQLRLLQRPPYGVQALLDCILILMRKKVSKWHADENPDVRPGCSWSQSQEMLTQKDFLNEVLLCESRYVNAETAELIAPLLNSPDLSLTKMSAISPAAGTLFSRLDAASLWGQIDRETSVHQSRSRLLRSKYSSAAAELAQEEERYHGVQAKAEKHQAMFEESAHHRVQVEERAVFLKNNSKALQAMVESVSESAKLWENDVADIEDSLRNMIGDSVIAAATLTYCGPFNVADRIGFRSAITLDRTRRHLSGTTKNDSEDFDVASFLHDAATRTHWSRLGLSRAPQCVESASIGLHNIQTGNRWPLILDRHGVGIEWFRRIFTRGAWAETGFVEVSVTDARLGMVLNLAEQMGSVVLIQMIGNESNENDALRFFLHTRSHGMAMAHPLTSIKPTAHSRPLGSSSSFSSNLGSHRNVLSTNAKPPQPFSSASSSEDSKIRSSRPLGSSGGRAADVATGATAATESGGVKRERLENIGARLLLWTRDVGNVTMDIYASTVTVDFSFDNELLEDILLEHVVRAFGDDTYERWEAASALTVEKVTEHDILFETLILQMGSASRVSLVEDIATVSALMATSQKATAIETEVSSLSAAEEIATDVFNGKCAKLQPVAARAASLFAAQVSMSRLDPLYFTMWDRFEAIFKTFLQHESLSAAAVKNASDCDGVVFSLTQSMASLAASAYFDEHRVLYALSLAVDVLAENSSTKVSRQDFSSGPNPSCAHASYRNLLTAPESITIFGEPDIIVPVAPPQQVSPTSARRRRSANSPASQAFVRPTELPPVASLAKMYVKRPLEKRSSFLLQQQQGVKPSRPTAGTLSRIREESNTMRQAAQVALDALEASAQATPKTPIGMKARTCPLLWMKQRQWDNAMRLVQELPRFKNLTTMLKQQEEKWLQWYRADRPEELDPPDKNYHEASERLILIRCLREDRFAAAVHIFCTSVLGQTLFEMITLSSEMASWIPSTIALDTMPVSFTITGEGAADPTESIMKSAETCGVGCVVLDMRAVRTDSGVSAMKKALSEDSWIVLQAAQTGAYDLDLIASALEEFLPHFIDADPAESSDKPETGENIGDSTGNKNPRNASAGSPQKHEAGSVAAYRTQQYRLHTRSETEKETSWALLPQQLRGRVWIATSSSSHAPKAAPLSILSGGARRAKSKPGLGVSGWVRGAMMTSASFVERHVTMPKDQQRIVIFIVGVLMAMSNARSQLGIAGWCAPKKFHQNDLLVAASQLAVNPILRRGAVTKYLSILQEMVCAWFLNDGGDLSRDSATLRSMVFGFLTPESTVKLGTILGDCVVPARGERGDLVSAVGHLPRDRAVAEYGLSPIFDLANDWRDSISLMRGLDCLSNEGAPPPLRQHLVSAIPADTYSQPIQSFPGSVALQSAKFAQPTTPATVTPTGGPMASPGPLSAPNTVASVGIVNSMPGGGTIHAAEYLHLFVSPSVASSCKWSGGTQVALSAPPLSIIRPFAVLSHSVFSELAESANSRNFLVSPAGYRGFWTCILHWLSLLPRAHNSSPLLNVSAQTEAGKGRETTHAKALERYWRAEMDRLKSLLSLVHAVEHCVRRLTAGGGGPTPDARSSFEAVAALQNLAVPPQWLAHFSFGQISKPGSLLGWLERLRLACIQAEDWCRPSTERISHTVWLGGLSDPQSFLSLFAFKSLAAAPTTQPAAVPDAAKVKEKDKEAAAATALAVAQMSASWDPHLPQPNPIQLAAYVTLFDSPDQVRQDATEGVFVTGVAISCATWEKKAACAFVNSNEATLRRWVLLPILHVVPTTKIGSRPFAATMRLRKEDEEARLRKQDPAVQKANSNIGGGRKSKKGMMDLEEDVADMLAQRGASVKNYNVPVFHSAVADGVADFDMNLAQESTSLQSFKHKNPLLFQISLPVFETSSAAAIDREKKFHSRGLHGVSVAPAQISQS